MGLRFTVLASGSAGNASLIETGGFGLLLDAGLGPRQLATRLAAVGASWQDVHAVIAAFQAPLDLPGTIHSLVDDVEQRGFEFEKSGGWSPALGATRIAMLPSP